MEEFKQAEAFLQNTGVLSLITDTHVEDREAEEKFCHHGSASALEALKESVERIKTHNMHDNMKISKHIALAFRYLQLKSGSDFFLQAVCCPTTLDAIVSTCTPHTQSRPSTSQQPANLVRRSHCRLHRYTPQCITPRHSQRPTNLSRGKQQAHAARHTPTGGLSSAAAFFSPNPLRPTIRPIATTAITVSNTPVHIVNSAGQPATAPQPRKPKPAQPADKRQLKLIATGPNRLFGMQAPYSTLAQVQQQCKDDGHVGRMTTQVILCCCAYALFCLVCGTACALLACCFHVLCGQVCGQVCGACAHTTVACACGVSMTLATGGHGGVRGVPGMLPKGERAQGVLCSTHHTLSSTR